MVPFYRRFTKLRKATVICVVFVCPYVCLHEQLRSNNMDFHEI